VKWARGLAPRLEQTLREKDQLLRVRAGRGVPYFYEIHSYKSGGTEPADPRPYRDCYSTDLLVYDETADGTTWVPRLVIECKKRGGDATTHGAIAYSVKAATHKNVHPYLRYGMLIGGYEHIRPYLVRHGVGFDFIAVWEELEPV